MQRYTLQELQVIHIKALFSDVVAKVDESPKEYVWQPLPLPVHGRVQRAISAYTS